MSDDCPPIMTLPDDMLCEIFSLITDIPFKLQMESVCKRFQRISTTQTNSWKGNDKLELVAGFCEEKWSFYSPLPMIKYLADCTIGVWKEGADSSYLNGHEMSVNKWVAAIGQLLQRAVVRKLCIHINDASLVTDEQPLLKQVFEVLQNHSSRLRLTHIEFHRKPTMLDYGPEEPRKKEKTGVKGKKVPRREKKRAKSRPPGPDVRDDLYHWAASESVDTLKSIVLTLEYFHYSAEEKWAKFCPQIAACNGLKSFSLSMPLESIYHKPAYMKQLSDALQGKPLKSVTIDGQVQSFDGPAGPDPLTQFLLLVCQNAIGGGITSLKVTFLEEPYPRYGLVGFANALHPPTAQSLVELWINNGDASRFLPDLDNLPAMFPNLEDLHLVNLNSPDVDEAVLLNTQFFTVCDATPLVNRKVFISYVVIDGGDEFRAGVANFCEEQGVEAIFGQGERHITLTLKKGRGTIHMEIRELWSSSDSDFDSSEDDEAVD